MSREGIVYTHYGHTEFSKENFQPIRNKQMFNKPFGGFWASANDAQFGWKQWNERERFAEINDDNKIEFKLKSGARVLEIHSVKDAMSMIAEYRAPMPPELAYLSQLGFGGSMLSNIDFEAIAKEYDAIEFFISDDWGLYQTLYGWDCDSILILHPAVVEQIKEKNIEEKVTADSILEDIVIIPQKPTYKQDFYQIVEDILEEDEHGQLSFMSYFDSEEKGR